MEGMQPLEAALARTLIHRSIMREKERGISGETAKKKDDEIACSSEQQERGRETVGVSIIACERESERASQLTRERGRERESGAALNHVADPQLSLCSCARQSERRGGESASESRGNSRTTYHLAKRSMHLRHTGRVSSLQDVRVQPERERESGQRDRESEESRREEDYPGPIWTLSAGHSEQVS